MVHALQSRIAERKQTLLLKYERVMEQLKKLPAPIRRIIAIFLFLIGVVSLFNPLVPGWLFLLASAQLVIYQERKVLKAFAQKHKEHIHKKVIKKMHFIMKKSKRLSSPTRIRQVYYRKKLSSMLTMNDG